MRCPWWAGPVGGPGAERLGRKMMRTLKWLLVLSVPAVWVAAARPAEPHFPSGTVAKLILLRQKSVQKELGLSPEVVQKIMAFTQKQYQAAEKAMSMDKAGRDKTFAQLLKEDKEFMAANLKPEQVKRLDQIVMQFNGLRHLVRKAIIKKLKLTPAQVTKLKTLRAETIQKLQKVLQATDAKERKENFAKLHQSTRKKVAAILTAAQKKKVKAMIGKLFDGEIEFGEIGAKSNSK
jgi:hypothetical protein